MTRPMFFNTTIILNIYLIIALYLTASPITKITSSFPEYKIKGIELNKTKTSKIYAVAPILCAFLPHRYFTYI